MKKEVILFLLLLLPISLAVCEGCLLGDKCIGIGEQRLTKENGYEIYCSQDKTLEKAKELGESCFADYECKSYYCDMVCKKGTTGSASMSISFIKFLIPSVLTIILLYFIFRFIKTRKIKKPVKKQQGVKIRPVQKKDYDKIEKDLDKSVEELSQLSKKK